jgi:hypothetical protein
VCGKERDPSMSPERSTSEEHVTEGVGHIEHPRMSDMGDASHDPTSRFTLGSFGSVMLWFTGAGWLLYMAIFWAIKWCAGRPGDGSILNWIALAAWLAPGVAGVLAAPWVARRVLTCVVLSAFTCVLLTLLLANLIF